MTPSRKASLSAFTCSSERSGGLTRSDVSATAPSGQPYCRPRSPSSARSVSVRWCGVTSAVTVRPRSRAERSSFTAPAVDACATCRRPPVSARSCKSRSMMFVSASAEAAGRPSCAAASPSCAIAFPMTAGSSECWLRDSPSRADSRSAALIRSLSTTADPSSLNSAAPAVARPPRSESSRPARLNVMVPIGSTRTTATSRARSAT